jgi:glyoxylase-like metal-dependent hydrolase (beta-lactamase superfamily II)
MRVGDIDVVSVRDGSGAMPPSMVFPATEEQWRPHRHFLDANGMLLAEVGGFLIRGGRLGSERVVLVDLGLGPLGTKFGMGQFLDSLSSYQVTPSDVTDVLFTHLHVDHIGWATVDGAPTFPNATYRCASQDWSYFVESGGAAQVPVAAMLDAPPEAEILRPLADRIEFWREGPLMPGIDLVLAPGHTPGSTLIVISSATSRALLLGDIVRCPVQLLDPEWEVLYDVDPALARRTREELIREYEGTSVPMAAAHFADMQFGRLLPARGARRWVVV